MQIVVVHNHYQFRGGEDESFQSELRILQEGGHNVVTFTQHNDRVNEIGALRTAARAVWSKEAYSHVRSLLRQNKTDLLHIQNFFPLISPSVYYAGRAEGVPIVQSLRNYRLLCPDALFFRDGKVCEECMGKFVPWPGVVHGCYRGSRGAAAAVAGMITSHRVAGTWNNMVDLYIALTEFARKKFVEGGLPAEKIVVKPNFVYPDPGVGGHNGTYALFVGRLSEEKGMGTLLKAWERTNGKRVLRIVGDGPMLPMVQEAAARMPTVEYLGRRSVSQVYDLMADAEMLVFPSEWYETFGRVAVEAFAKGTPVVAANTGAIAELVDDKRTGLLFTPGNVDDLQAKLEWAWAHPQHMREMGEQARCEYVQKYTAERNYHMLMDIYARAATNAKAHR